MYGGGGFQVGDRVQIVDRSYDGIDDINEWGEKYWILSPQRTPQHLVGKTGEIMDVIDWAYDTDSRTLTGYENIELRVMIDCEEITVDSRCCKPLNKQENV